MSQSVAVTVRALATLARHAPPDGRLVLPAGATAGDAAALLGLDWAAIGTVLVDGRPADQNTRLGPGDTVSFVPPITGG
ncbi:thiamine S protein [Solidesulfovibrio carbinoliphilus subsp. oakridgensis]|uniref:Thiamine S protein n=1 Tax=Solidesulfovibrio carbinoliphilus subsp. oakridgensis TaxID=694327 RepID=G7Q8G5_9BACT|nr:MoaD/ThiS family protein [Solidesulfovibrio carbinoliphilus]EHJ48577.1 thiamine S protein [Solidesulfovibrio carbinoliphilus subsp. oakridgensis]